MRADIFHQPSKFLLWCSFRDRSRECGGYFFLGSFATCCSRQPTSCASAERPLCNGQRTDNCPLTTARDFDACNCSVADADAARGNPQAAHRLRGPSATDNARTTARGTHKRNKGVDSSSRAVCMDAGWHRRRGCRTPLKDPQTFQSHKYHGNEGTLLARHPPATPRYPSQARVGSSSRGFVVVLRRRRAQASTLGRAVARSDLDEGRHRSHAAHFSPLSFCNAIRMYAGKTT